MNKSSRSFLVIGAFLLILLIGGQIASFLLAPASWQAFIARLPVVLSMVAFWGPIVAHVGF
jgi:hypothetical protein